MTAHEEMTHEQAIELLPWFVNESLDAGEHEAVQAHASSCVICRREIEELEVLQRSIREAPVLEEMPAVDMRRINARIDAQLERDTLPLRLLATMRDWLHSAAGSGRLAGEKAAQPVDPTVDESGVTALFESSGLMLVSGPSERGVITLRFADDTDGDERDDIVRKMREDRRVLFAEAVESGK